MELNKVIEISDECIRNNFHSIREWLLNDLNLPTALLREPSYFDLAIDLARRRTYSTTDGLLQSQSIMQWLQFRELPSQNVEPLYYEYETFYIGVDLEKLEEHSVKAQIQLEALLEILILHELVHVWMTSFIARRDVVHEWLSLDLRYVHEATALKTCDSGIDSLVKIAKRRDIDKYLEYADSESYNPKAKVEHPYRKFFEIRNTPNNSFWNHLTNNEPALSALNSAIKICTD